MKNSLDLHRHSSIGSIRKVVPGAQKNNNRYLSQFSTNRMSDKKRRSHLTTHRNMDELRSSFDHKS